MTHRNTSSSRNEDVRQNRVTSLCVTENTTAQKCSEMFAKGLLSKQDPSSLEKSSGVVESVYGYMQSPLTGVQVFHFP